MSTIDFQGIVVSDKDTRISRNGEIVYIKCWLLEGTWDKDDERLKALCAEYTDAAGLREDSRGVYLEVAICVCSIKGVREAKKKLAARMYKHLRISATIQ